MARLQLACAVQLFMTPCTQVKVLQHGREESLGYSASRGLKPAQLGSSVCSRKCLLELSIWRCAERSGWGCSGSWRAAGASQGLPHQRLVEK